MSVRIETRNISEIISKQILEVSRYKMFVLFCVIFSDQDSNVKIVAFLVLISCNPIGGYQRFEGICHIYLQGRSEVL
jgi:hypothetical protein